MSINIEDVLLLKARQDAAAKNDNGGAATAGALAGGLAGVGLGHLGERLRPMTQERIVASRGAGALRPGGRMAGGLVGAILGGALGVGAKQMMIQGSPAGELLAKIQVDGELTPAEANQLRGVLADTYNNIVS